MREQTTGITVLLDTGVERTPQEIADKGIPSNTMAHWLVIRSEGIRPFCVSIADVTAKPIYGPMALAAMREECRLNPSAPAPRMSEQGWCINYDRANKLSKWGGGGVSSLGSKDQWKALYDEGRKLCISYMAPSVSGPIRSYGNINALLYALGGDVIGTKPYWCDSPADGDGMMVDIVEERFGNVAFSRKDARQIDGVFARKFMVYSDFVTDRIGRNNQVTQN